MFCWAEHSRTSPDVATVRGELSLPCEQRTLAAGSNRLRFSAGVYMLFLRCSWSWSNSNNRETRFSHSGKSTSLKPPAGSGFLPRRLWLCPRKAMVHSGKQSRAHATVFVFFTLLKLLHSIRQW